MPTSDRKSEHLDICLTRDVRSRVSTGLERYRFRHQSLPGLDLRDVDLSTCVLSKPLCAPLLISPMTGGTPAAHKVNLRLAEAAQTLGIAMGLGSQRAAIESPELMDTYRVRQVAPDILLFANIGAVQLNYGYGVDHCRRAVDAVEADALVLHLNPLQEALQPEGNTRFGGLIGRIATLCQALPCPVIAKETGAGISSETALALVEAGVVAIDVGGAGGTSWSEVERYRNASPLDADVAAAFANWGIPTAESLVSVRKACPDTPVVASGGITDGVMAAKCLALGACLVGIARPFLQPATESTRAVIDKIGVVLRQLSIAMFCCGAGTIGELDASRIYCEDTNGS